MPDMLSFDGSRSPNPGGRITLGWQIVWANSVPPLIGREELPPHPNNTVNTAEYQALLRGIADYIASGGRGPLVVRGDSQLVINQMRGSYKVRDALVPPARATREALASNARRVDEAGSMFLLKVLHP
jgi:ribonuclease HI